MNQRIEHQTRKAGLRRHPQTRKGRKFDARFEGRNRKYPGLDLCDCLPTMVVLLLASAPALRSQPAPSQPASAPPPPESGVSAQISNEEKTNNAPGLLSLGKGESPDVPHDARPFQLTLPRAHLFGDWSGARPWLEDKGVVATLTYVMDFAGNVTGGKEQGATHADNLGLDLLFDLDRLAGLQGGSFLASVSQRSGTSLSQKHVGNVFTIQQVYGGQTFHLIDLAYSQRLFEDRVEVRLGRIATGDDFLVSPYNWLFMQNGFDGNPVGIFFNSPGMTAYPNATWGARAKVRTSERTYVMGGVYNGDPEIRDISHNGADMSMNGPVFAIGEAGFQLNGRPGDSRRLGNYKVGGWYDNSTYADFNTVGYATPAGSKQGNWGFYTMIDQVLVPFGDPAINRGFGIFGSALISPDQSVSQMPYFFTAGVAARGVFASRPADVAGFGVVHGRFSEDLRHAQEREQLVDPTVGIQTHETVLEWAYRFYFRQGALFFQPDIQHVIRPGGTGKIDNALVLGFQLGLNF